MQLHKTTNSLENWNSNQYILSTDKSLIIETSKNESIRFYTKMLCNEVTDEIAFSNTKE